MLPLLVISVLLCASRAHGSSSLSASQFEHSPEISGLFDWLRENGAKVRPSYSPQLSGNGLHALRLHSLTLLGH